MMFCAFESDESKAEGLVRGAPELELTNLSHEFAYQSFTQDTRRETEN